MLFTGCISHYSSIVDIPSNNHNNEKTSIVLSIKENRFVLEKTWHQHMTSFADYYGKINRINRDSYELISDYNPLSIPYPIKAFYDSEIKTGMKIEISTRIPFEKLFVDDMLFQDSITAHYQGGVSHFTFTLSNKIKSLQLVSKDMLDVLFQTYKIYYKSERYIIPDTCNRVIIEAIAGNMYPIGIPHLIFDHKKMILFSDSNIIYFNTQHNTIDSSIKKENEKILRRK